MIVCFSGSHSTGKSTLVNYFKTQEQFECIDSVTRSNTTNEERKIDNSLTDLNETQLRISDKILSTMKDLIEQSRNFPDKVFLLDRSVFDFLAYSKVFFDRGLLDKDTYLTLYLKLKPLYEYFDIVYYLPIEFPIVSDGERNEDEKLRQDVDTELFKLLSSQSELKTIKLIKLTGTVESRIATVEDTIMFSKKTEV